MNAKLREGLKEDAENTFRNTLSKSGGDNNNIIMKNE